MFILTHVRGDHMARLFPTFGADAAGRGDLVNVTSSNGWPRPLLQRVYQFWAFVPLHSQT
ncbi:hypothetical protein ASNO1_29670 [Corallococcus caeni]|uniref:MBL fold metallo-hydrolase n=1 Tax=Corallococcus caeni TaxID=3082388 RepID=A0ABQ6QRR3_9BACT|nr:hypothetical protein ASNO1_29670 [Corallococcus sp. NO1]